MLLSINVFAAPAPQWAEDSNGNRSLEVLGINPGGNGGNGTLISLVNANIPSGADGCDYNTALFLSGDDNPDYNSLFSLVLAAKMSGKKIKVRYGGCSANSYYPLIEQIYLE